MAWLPSAAMGSISSSHDGLSVVPPSNRATHPPFAPWSSPPTPTLRQLGQQRHQQSLERSSHEAPASRQQHPSTSRAERHSSIPRSACGGRGGMTISSIISNRYIWISNTLEYSMSIVCNGQAEPTFQPIHAWQLTSWSISRPVAGVGLQRPTMA